MRRSSSREPRATSERACSRRSARRAADRGDRRDRAPRPRGTNPKTRFVTADVEQRPTCEPLFADADAVIHLAWLIQPVARPQSELRARERPRARSKVFEAAARGGRPKAIVHASSVGVYSYGPKDRRGRRVMAARAASPSILLRAPQGGRRAHPGRDRGHRMRIVRLRPGLIFKREAATGDSEACSSARSLPTALAAAAAAQGAARDRPTGAPGGAFEATLARPTGWRADEPGRARCLQHRLRPGARTRATHGVRKVRAPRLPARGSRPHVACRACSPRRPAGSTWASRCR